MSSINPNDPYSIDQIIREDIKKKALNPPPPGKDFNTFVQSKKKEDQPPKSQLEPEPEEFAVGEEASDYYTPAPSQQAYAPVKFSMNQVKLINSLELESKEESEISEKLEEVLEANENTAKKNEIKQNLKKENAADIKELTEKSSEEETVTVDMSSEEIKKLQSLIQKNASEKNPDTENLMKQLDGALQNAEEAARQSAVKDGKSQLPASQPADMNKKAAESQSKSETPLSPMEALMQTSKSAPLQKPKTVQERNTEPKEPAISEASGKPGPQEPAMANKGLPDADNQVDQNKEQVSNLTEKLEAKAAAEKALAGQTSENSAMESRENAETVSQTNLQDASNSQETSLKDQTAPTATRQDAVPPIPGVEGKMQETLINPVIVGEEARKANLQAIQSGAPLSPDRAIESLLNQRFSSKKEAMTGIPQEGKQPQPMKEEAGTAIPDAAKQAEVASSQIKPAEAKPTESAAQPLETKSGRKGKESERTLEAEISSASAVAPAFQGIEGSVQLQPDRQEVSKESLTQLIKELVDQILVIKTQGQTDTVVTLRSPKILEGATIKISTYDQARGEVNITFANLSPEAKKLLDNNLARESLSDTLKERSDIIVHNIITTTQAETPYILPEKQVRDEQEKEGQQGGQQQEDENPE